MIPLCQVIHVLLAVAQPARCNVAQPSFSFMLSFLTQDSFRYGPQGSRLAKQVIRWEPRPAAHALAEKFRQMAHGDYAKRCQICSKTFRMRNGESQAFVLHLVRPCVHPGTNHFGDLVSLCGWHYALIQYGQWALIDPETEDGIEDPELMLRGDLERCLIVCPANLAEQWQDEMREKFQVDFAIIGRSDIESSASGNPFNDRDLVIGRIDLLKQDDNLERLKSAEWDLVVVDESHRWRKIDNRR